jgi:CBS domain-containing protein
VLAALRRMLAYHASSTDPPPALTAVLLAVELLLFEWKPRSLVPVALASATGCAVPDRRDLGDLMRKDPVVVYPDEPLRVVVYRMAETGLTRLPVIDREGSRKLVGIISLDDLLHARVRNLEQERRRERVLRIHLPFGHEKEMEEAGQTSGVSNGSETDSSSVAD